MPASRKVRIVIATTVIILFVLLLYSLPLIIPDGIAVTSISVKGNPVIPLTSNPSFEHGSASWYVHPFPPSSVAVSSGEALSGEHSLFINAIPQDAGTIIAYDNSSTLPIVLSNSMVYSFSIYYQGSIASSQFSSLDSVITISYLDKYNISLLIFVTNPGSRNATEIRMTTLGISFTRGITSPDSWQTFILQLGTPRMIHLYQSFLYDQYGINASSDITNYFFMGFYMHPNNIICFVDNVGLYDVFPATISITITKASPFSSASYLKSIAVNGEKIQEYSYSYGFISDSYTISLPIPLVQGSNITVQLLVISGEQQVYNYTITSGPIPI